jgi:hypothetical protein
MEAKRSKIDFEVFWSIYCDSFPPEERRSRESQQRIMEDDRYLLVEIEYECRHVGFLASWDLGSFVFGEHFAMDAACRGTGIGTDFLRRFMDSLTKPLIIEVEPPHDAISERRIAFYQRLGLKLNSHEYLQPPYEKGQRALSLKLMSYPGYLTEAEFNEALDKLYRVVYKSLP